MNEPQSGSPSSGNLTSGSVEINSVMCENPLFGTDLGTCNSARMERPAPGCRRPSPVLSPSNERIIDSNEVENSAPNSLSDSDDMWQFAMKSDFVIGQLLGEGAFGQVRRCMFRKNNVHYAAKILARSRMKNNIQQAKFVENEQDILADLDHPNVVRLFCSFSDLRNIYMIMELVNGGELFSNVRQYEQVEISVVQYYMGELLLALEHLHERAIVHRDLKPENLLLSAEGHLKLTDFGLASRLTPDQPLQALCGTAEYLAPEMLARRGYSFEVDWWAWGCVLFEFITGTTPFLASSVVLTYQKILERGLSYPENYPSTAKDLTDRVLQVDPALRLGHDGTQALKKHPFFSSLHFDQLRFMDPPIKPSISEQDAILTDGFSHRDAEEERNKLAEEAFVVGLSKKVNNALNHQDILRRSEIMRRLYPELLQLPPRPAFLRDLNAGAEILPINSASPSPSPSPRLGLPAGDGDDRSASSSPGFENMHVGGGGLNTSAFGAAAFRHIKTLVNHKAPIRALAWDTGTKRLAVASNFWCHLYRKHNVLNGGVRMVQLSKQATVSSANFVAFSPNDRYIAVDLLRYVGLLELSENSSAVPMHQLSGHTMPVTSVAFNSESTTLVSGGADAQVLFWDIARHKALHKMRCHSSYVTSVAWRPSTALVASAGGDGLINIINAAAGKVERHIGRHQQGVLAVSWHPSMLRGVTASISLDRTLMLVDVDASTIIKAMAHPTPVQHMRFSPDGKYIATSATDCVRIWSFPGLKLVAAYAAGASLKDCPISWAHDSSYLASAGDHCVPVVYSLKSNSFVSVSGFEHNGPITCLEFSPRSNHLVVGSTDHSVSVWDMF